MTSYRNVCAGMLVKIQQGHKTYRGTRVKDPLCRMGLDIEARFKLRFEKS
jgi:hypothetical protein